ncbi:threonine-phosphate decarboxylase CobD [Roseovarius sp. MMSF_3281]|uniref:threonine-phosphate decarboxylase CobD n=1 Tax=Roseovarius sp. MMSF_3281 TaxID=3046694 RepID=UPI00273D5EEF|nr:threonine-phosphate decarboxylase CobD [Roseovarius sp. MMSF_3281]
MQTPRDHGGGVDAAVAEYGGRRKDWIDLSTGINPVPYPVPAIAPDVWTALPDSAAQDALLEAARRHWHVPEGAAVLAAPGASSLIAKLPMLAPVARVDIPAPTYNEHAAAFTAHGWDVGEDAATARVIVHPNNPTGHWYAEETFDLPLTVIDESFADVWPDRTWVQEATRPGVVILKSFGKFWGLAGMRLGFAIAAPETIEKLATALGPWAVSGPALTIGAAALNDHEWAVDTRVRLNEDAARLDALMTRAGARVQGGTSLFRLYEVDDAKAWQARLARNQIWSRVFPYSKTWLRLGLPAPQHWSRLEAAL